MAEVRRSIPDSVSLPAYEDQVEKVAITISMDASRLLRPHSRKTERGPHRRLDFPEGAMLDRRLRSLQRRSRTPIRERPRPREGSDPSVTDYVLKVLSSRRFVHGLATKI